MAFDLLYFLCLCLCLILPTYVQTNEISKQLDDAENYARAEKKSSSVLTGVKDGIQSIAGEGIESSILSTVVPTADKDDETDELNPDNIFPGKPITDPNYEEDVMAVEKPKSSDSALTKIKDVGKSIAGEGTDISISITVQPLGDNEDNKDELNPDNIFPGEPITDPSYEELAMAAGKSNIVPESMHHPHHQNHTHSPDSTDHNVNKSKTALFDDPNVSSGAKNEKEDIELSLNKTDDLLEEHADEHEKDDLIDEDLDDEHVVKNEGDDLIKEKEDIIKEDEDSIEEKEDLEDSLNEHAVINEEEDLIEDHEELEDDQPEYKKLIKEKYKIKKFDKDEDEIANVTMYLDIHGQSLKIHLHKVSTNAFLPNAFVSLIQDEKVNTGSIFNIATMKNLRMYEGSLGNSDGSYVCGSIVDSVFKGVILLGNGTVLYIEPTTSSQNLIAYRANDLRYQNCPETKNPTKMCQLYTSLVDSHYCKRRGRREILCFYGRKDQTYDEPPEENVRESKDHYHVKTVSDVWCSVRLISDSSHFVEAHNRDILSVVRELLTIFLHTNHIIRQLDLNDDGKPENLNMRLASITVYENTQEKPRDDPMVSKLKEASMEPQSSCLTLLFVNKELPKNDPISIAMDGSVCQNNKLGQKAAKNVAIINTKTPYGHSLYPASWVTLETIGQMMGSLRADCPSRHYLHNNWRQFFSKCKRTNMANTLILRGFCLELNIDTPHLNIAKQSSLGRCGNGIVEELEECDCGTILECKLKLHCCVPPGRMNECKLDRSKGFECDVLNRCCNSECKLIPEKEKKFCGPGDPVCTSDNAYCNGKSEHCPVKDDVAAVFNGRPCGLADTGTCEDGYCNQTLCMRSGYLDCECEKNSEHECHICCRKKETGSECVSSEKLNMGQELAGYRHGMTCGEDQLGTCNEFGACSLEQINGASNIHYYGILNSRLFKVFFVSFVIFWRTFLFQLTL